MKNFRRWRWWTVALRSVAALLLGIFALMAPGITFLTLVALFGCYAIIDGVLALTLARRSVVAPRGAVIARGIVSIVAGFVALLWPGLTGFAFLIVIATWAIVAGLLEIATAIRMRKALEHEWLLALEGAVSVAFGVILFIAPLVGAIVLGLWVGAFALVIGGMLMGTALRLRSYEHQHPLAATA